MGCSQVTKTFLAVILALAMHGCGTYWVWDANPREDPKNSHSTAPRARTIPYYCGLSLEVDLLFSSASWIIWMTPLGIMGLIDMPMTFIADTLMLPYTIYVDRKYHSEVENVEE